jgi:hypothetical protein
MRPALLARVLLLAALAVGLTRAGMLSQAQAKGGGNRKSPAPFTPIVKVVTGEPAASRDGAIQSALAKAREEMAKELKTPLECVPAKIVAECVTDLEDKPEKAWRESNYEGKRILVKEDEFAGVEIVPQAYQVRLRVEVSEKRYTEISKQVEQKRDELRRETVQQRQWFLGKVLLGVVAFLGALAGYIRLEDATKGYYTGWLRLAVVALLGAVGVGLWLVS